MTETHAKLGIKEIEEMVGKKAEKVVVRARDIVLYFCGGVVAGSCNIGPHEGGCAATIEWRIKKW